jgi:predicted esterase
MLAMFQRVLGTVLLVCNVAYAGLDETVVLLPNSWDHKTSLPVAIWLHGYRANPSGLLRDSHYQDTSDALGIAIVGVPGTQEEGPGTYAWAKDSDLDVGRVENALLEATRLKGVTFNRRILFGFSQGAIMAAELAARFPSRFCGAIVLSPGGDIFPTPIAAVPENRKQIYFISIGAGELQRRIAVARQYRQILGDLGSQVFYREVEGMSEHTRPPDWPERFREWVSRILNIQNDKSG